jgi:hypothetical protein
MAKMLYCWRCKMEIPMLEEHEWMTMLPLLKDGQQAALLVHYNEITGFNETNPNAIFHHRVSSFVPPCHRCGKPLRTPRAKLCAACGTARHAHHAFS